MPGGVIWEKDLKVQTDLNDLTQAKLRYNLVTEPFQRYNIYNKILMVNKQISTLDAICRSITIQIKPRTNLNYILQGTNATSTSVCGHKLFIIILKQRSYE